MISLHWAGGMTEDILAAEIETARALMLATITLLNVVRDRARETVCSRLECEAPAIYHFHLCEQHRCRGCSEPATTAPAPERRNPIRRARNTHNASPLGRPHRD